MPVDGLNKELDEMRRTLAIVSMAMFIQCQGCSTTRTQSIVDYGLIIGNAAYAAACSYVAANRSAFSREDYLSWCDFLETFGMALDTGKDVSGWVERWTQFVQGR